MSRNSLPKPTSSPAVYTENGNMPDATRGRKGSVDWSSQPKRPERTDQRTYQSGEPDYQSTESHVALPKAKPV
jgi:hypothetical protein